MSPLTQSELDSIYRRLISEPGKPVSKGTPRMIMVIGRKPAAKIRNLAIREPRRRARRKAHGGKKT